MSLTVGTTLQNGKFVIEAILHQSDFGVTYQAAHPSINQPIVLQSFNEALRQRSDFDSLRQKFLQEVLLFSKQPSETAQVIDCFEENGMPFVVLAAGSNPSIPYLSDWLEIPIEEPTQADQEVTQPMSKTSALTAALAAAFPESPKTAVVAAAIAPVPIAEVRTEAITLADAEELAPVLTAAVAAPSPILKSVPDQTTNGSRNKVTVLISGQSPKPKKWMPLALMMTALIAGFGGAGLGLALRFKPTPQNNNTSSLSSGWFGQDQSFPPQQEWPITETPNLYPSSSTFETLPDQASPPVENPGISKVQPSTGYIPPAQLAAPDYQPAPDYRPAPDYQPAPPGIADYPPLSPDPIPSVEPIAPRAPAAPPTPEVSEPVIPLPQPITSPALPETTPNTNKPPSSSKNVPAEAPILFHQ